MSEPTEAPRITFDDFLKVDIRVVLAMSVMFAVGQIWWCEDCGGGGFSRPDGGGGFSRPGGGGGGFSRPGGGGGFSRPGAPGGDFPAPEETVDIRGRRFRQKPETKPARKTSPRRRKDDIVEPDDEY